MTGHTHRQYSITFAFLVAMILYDNNLSAINYYLSLPIILQMSRYGGLFPDIDHHWDNVKDKTVPHKIINTLIRITGGKHRSWHTHSIDIMAVFVLISYFLPNFLFAYGKVSDVNKEVLSILMLSFSAGWFSHIVADMMTSAGVRITCISDFKLKLVPRKIGELKFNTGNEWERFVYKCTRIINMIMGTLCLIYPFLRSGYVYELLNSIIK